MTNHETCGAADMTACDDYVYPGPRFTQTGMNSGHGMGLTLRDWFAGQVLSGMCGHPMALSQTRYEDLLEDARLAYRFADSMIAARNGSAT